MEKLYYSLSDSDLKRYSNIKIVLYNDLKNYNNIDELLGKQKAVIILIETTHKFSGHWMLLWRNGNDVNFFDSFGFKIEEQKKFIKKGTGLLDRTNYLSIMLKNSPYNVHYNEYKFQDNSTAVCGRYCIYRLRNRKMTTEEFKNHIVKECNERGIHPDELMLLKVPI